MFFVLDNYDSFTYNLVQYLGELGGDPVVRRNDALTVEAVAALQPEALVISPGPGRPADAGLSIPLIHHFAGRVPILGVCLGHQAIGEAFGGRIVRAERLMHGKTSPVAHTGANVFHRLANPLTAMRYHSLVIDPASLPAELEVTAWSADRPAGQEIMGVQHRAMPVWGVQFHPESVGTDLGMQMMRTFVSLVRGA
ncbi:MAG: aminodeoxychorismate/anthranilate synthase component II [Gemmatimonadota bacterium]|nr:aminodeoxychorismate/anthranilate synthase component II [Gemmatimonadota bacterium]